MSVVVHTDVGLADIQTNGGTVTATRIGKHQARRLMDAAGCTYIIGMTDSSRVDAGVTSVDGSDECSESLAVAQLVEKRLP